MGDNPKWLKRRVRARMAETGEKYTKALRAIQDEMKPCKGGNTNICIAEGCYGEACLKLKEKEEADGRPGDGPAPHEDRA